MWEAKVHTYSSAECETKAPIQLFHRYLNPLQALKLEWVRD